MYRRDTINGDRGLIAFLENAAYLSPSILIPESPGNLSLRSYRSALPDLPGIQFQCKLRNALYERFHDPLIQLALQMQARLPELFLHGQKTLSLTLLLLRMLDLSEDEQTTIAMAALFHDIGKLKIDEALLHKATKLTPEEFAIIKRHAAYGARILKRFRSLADVALLVHHHHERWDGDGYPDGLSGEAIPLGARIITIADAFDAMTSNRSYQVRRTSMEAFDELQRCAGTQFDSLLVQLFRASDGHRRYTISSTRSLSAIHAARE
ncbi:MAG TPA: HD domain-containing phosphohydrolase [Ktedonobacteraceae bacterium]|nr:HD domain-containing phosphohydrolase [Ktedonobacteraceae bacterium]